MNMYLEPITIKRGGLLVDNFTAFVDGKEVYLTAREYRVLVFFMKHTGHVLTRKQLLSLIWGYTVNYHSRNADILVQELRRKIGHERIVTHRGWGYVFVEK